MHELGFRLKRAHLRAVAIHKPLAEKYDLTPARFDAMVVMWMNDGDCMQWQVVQQLGLAATTVSRMLRAMADRGLVWREPHYRDRRYMTVGLTAWGLECVAGAINEFLLGKALYARWDALHQEGRAFVARAIDTVKGITRGLWDWATHGYRHGEADDKAIAETEKYNATIRDTIRRLESHGLAGLGNPRGLAAADAARARKREREALEELDRSGREAMERNIAATREHEAQRRYLEQRLEQRLEQSEDARGEPHRRATAEGTAAPHDEDEGSEPPLVP